MIIFAWVPLVLGVTSGTAISMIIAVTGVGIAMGAVAIFKSASKSVLSYRLVWLCDGDLYLGLPYR